MELRLVSRSASIQSAVAGPSSLALGRRAARLGAWTGASSSFGALQQRIALELALHIGGQIETGELQQLDGLHQLRRHHQRLGLAKFQSLRQAP